MPTLRLSISKNEKEWNAIVKAVKKLHTSRKTPFKGDGVAQYISAELNKRYVNSENQDCTGIKVKMIRRCFMINVSAGIVRRVSCEADFDGVYPAELIEKLILNPLIGLEE